MMLRGGDDGDEEEGDWEKDQDEEDEGSDGDGDNGGGDYGGGDEMVTVVLLMMVVLMMMVVMMMTMVMIMMTVVKVISAIIFNTLETANEPKQAPTRGRLRHSPPRDRRRPPAASGRQRGVHEGRHRQVDVPERQRPDLDRVHRLVLRRQAGRPLVACSCYSSPVSSRVLHHLVLGAVLQDHSHL